jgi:hypothetical protein
MNLYNLVLEQEVVLIHHPHHHFLIMDLIILVGLMRELMQMQTYLI